MDRDELLRIIEKARRDGATELDLSLKGITELPDEIGNLTSLKRLDLHSNQLASVPESLGNLSNLTRLNLHSNQLTSVPESLGQLSSLTELYLHSNQLMSVPESLRRLSNLRQLRMYDNQLTRVPESLGGLANLTVLNLSGNKLASIPDWLGQLTNLTELYLYSNQLTRAPESLGNLVNLTKLSLFDNRLTSIPESLGKLTNLTGLYLYSNPLTSVPESLGNLSNLKELHLYSNQLTSVPESLGNLSNLTVLNLSNNKLTSIPAKLVDLNMELKWGRLLAGGGIILGGNPLESPPVEVVKRGREAVREWLAALEEEGKRQLNEVKVLLVGYGGAGKTSLVWRLTKGEFNENEAKTHGVNIDDWPIEVDGEEITVHLWDYGGQGIMQATHRVFFSHRSLYVLVIDARQESDPEEWLKNIESIGGGSPVMVVINKTDEHVFGLNEPELQRKYRNIMGFYDVSCLSGDGIELFKEHLKEQTGQVEMRGMNWPVNWAKVRQRVGELKDDYITYSRYEEICKEKGVVDEKAQQELIGILHELGVLLHFPDRALEDTEVLNPEWATRGIYKVINSEELKKRGGRLKRSRLEYVFNKERLADQKGRGKHYSWKERDYIVELMNKFELCYELDASTILVPDLLGEKEPAGVPEGADVRFYFEYDFMPAVVLPRFMVQSSKDIVPDLCWRTGAVLRSEVFDSVAVVRQDKYQRRIYVEVSGGQARDYFATIRKTIEDINGSFAKLPVTRWVPLPDEEKEAVKYEDLIGHEIERRDEKFVGELRKGYPVAELLGRIERKEERLAKVLRMMGIGAKDIKGGDINIILSQIFTGDNPRVSNVEKMRDHFEGADVEVLKKILGKMGDRDK